ncbi:porin [Candidatus Pelagibacter ubique]|nr:porin [Candidatus Pelagibacter ubique]
MNNFKKIGMSALAASLVSTSAFAGELTASGSASVTMEGFSGTAIQTETGLSMGDSVYLAGSTELDNGMTVSMSFELDGVNEGGTSAYDNNSLTVSSDSLGTITFSAHGGSSASTAIDTTAAGDIMDNFDDVVTTAGGNAAAIQANLTKEAGAGNNSIYYTLPSMVDGLSVSASLATSGQGDGSTGNNAVGYNAVYTGVEGLSIAYGIADIETGASASDGDQTVMKASYAYGPVTASYSNSDYSVGAANTEALAQEVTSYAVSYTVSDAISLTYGTETVESGLSTDTDAEYEKLSASYTAGGMTVTVTSADGDNISHTTASNEDMEYWALGLSFAF